MGTIGAHAVITEAAILRKYGPILTVEQIGEVMHYVAGTVENKIARGTLGVRVTKRGASWITTAAEMARYIDAIDQELEKQ